MPDLRYSGGDPTEALDFFRAHREEMRALRRVLVGPEGATVKDINGDAIHLMGLTVGLPELEALLQMVGASYDPATLKDPPRGRSQSKEFQIVKQHPWGQDRVL